MSTAASSLAAPRRLLYLLPAMIFAIVAGYFLWGLDPQRDPREVPSVMIDKGVPDFDLPAIAGMEGPGLSTADLAVGEVTLVNFFASWCIPCRAEHPILAALAEQDGVRLIGVNYKNDAGQARDWLAKLGNPYVLIGADVSGRVAIDWGVYGVPETFIVDGEGRIRYRHVGPVDHTVVDETIRPMIAALSR